MKTVSAEEQILLGQHIAEQIATEVADNISEAITQVVLAGMIDFDIAPQVNKQVWIELAIQCSERVKNHGG